MPKPFKITTVSAYLSTDKDGVEGIIGELDPTTGQWFPFVCADHTRAEQLRPRVAQIAKASGRRIVLAQFSIRTDIEEFDP